MSEKLLEKSRQKCYNKKGINAIVFEPVPRWEKWKLLQKYRIGEGIMSGFLPLIQNTLGSLLQLSYWIQLHHQLVVLMNLLVELSYWLFMCPNCPKWGTYLGHKMGHKFGVLIKYWKSQYNSIIGFLWNYKSFKWVTLNYLPQVPQIRHKFEAHLGCCLVKIRNLKIFRWKPKK